MDFLESPRFLRTLIDSVTVGLLYALIAVGYTMVYGIIKLINFAHGEVFMVGAFLGLIIVNAVGIGYGIPLTLMVFGLGILLVMFRDNAHWHRVEVPMMLALVGALVAAVAWQLTGLPWLYPTATGGAGLLALVLAIGLWKAPGQQLAVMTLAIVGASGAAFLATQGGDPGGLSRGGIWLALPLAMLGCMALGWLIDLAAYRPLRGSSRLSALITAIGISLSLQTIVQLISPNPYVFEASNLPSWTDQAVVTLSVGKASIGILGKEIAVCVLAVLLMVGLDLLVNFTKTGKAMRACSLDQKTAALMGIDVDRVIVVTFMLGSAMAAVAGIMQGIKVGGNVNFRFGYYPGLIAFAAAVLGGIGSIRGAFLGGLVLGFTQIFTKTYVSTAYEFGPAFGVMILMILVRPQGLLGKPEAKRA